MPESATLLDYEGCAKLIVLNQGLVPQCLEEGQVLGNVQLAKVCQSQLTFKH